MPLLVDIGVGAVLIACALLLVSVGLKIFKELTKDGDSK